MGTSIQFNTKVQNAGGPFTIAYASNNTAGNTSVVIVRSTNTTSDLATATSVTDSQSNSYTLVSHGIDTAGFNFFVAVWVATGIKAGANTVTISNTTLNGNFVVLIVDEEPPCTFHIQSITNPGFASTTVNVTLAGTSNNDIIIGACQSNQSITVGTVNGQTAMDLDGNGSNGDSEEGTATGSSCAVAFVGTVFVYVLSIVALSRSATTSYLAPTDSLFFGMP